MSYIVEAVGAAAIVAGVGLVSVPAALVLAGVMLALAGYAMGGR